MKHQPRNFVWAISLAITLLFSQLSYSACPSKSKEEWLQYFKIEADKLGASKSYYSEETNKIANQCAPTWNLLGLGQCSTRITIASDSREKTTNSGGSMGWEMSDKDYIKNIPKEFRSLPADLRDGLPDNYREVAKANGWKVFKYRSRTVPNPPRSSYNRVLIVVPGRKDDKYIQFTISDDPSRPDRPERLVDFISVEHNKNDPEKNAQVHFTQFWRNEKGKKPVDKIHGGDDYDSCYSCHPNGVRELSPEPGSYNQEDAKSLKEIKAMMSGYGKQEYNGALRREAHGAPMGSNQGCVKCHNNYEGQHVLSRGAINGTTSRAHISHKMTQDMSMPMTGLDSEKEVFDLMDQIPELLTEEERLKFQAKMRDQQEGKKLNFAIEELLALGKITKKKASRLGLILNGSPEYPDCLGSECFMGINKKYKKMAKNLDLDYIQSSKDYYYENCSGQNLVAGSDGAVEVNQTRRRNFFGRIIDNLFGSDQDEGMIGGEQ